MNPWVTAIIKMHRTLVPCKKIWTVTSLLTRSDY